MQPAKDVSIRPPSKIVPIIRRVFKNRREMQAYLKGIEDAAKAVRLIQTNQEGGQSIGA